MALEPGRYPDGNHSFTSTEGRKVVAEVDRIYYPDGVGREPCVAAEALDPENPPYDCIQRQSGPMPGLYPAITSDRL
jgi:hypothetical protein